MSEIQSNIKLLQSEEFNPYTDGSGTITDSNTFVRAPMNEIDKSLFSLIVAGETEKVFRGISRNSDFPVHATIGTAGFQPEMHYFGETGIDGQMTLSCVEQKNFSDIESESLAEVLAAVYNSLVENQETLGPEIENEINENISSLYLTE